MMQMTRMLTARVIGGGGGDGVQNVLNIHDNGDSIGSQSDLDIEDGGVHNVHNSEDSSGPNTKSDGDVDNSEIVSCSEKPKYTRDFSCSFEYDHKLCDH